MDQTEEPVRKKESERQTLRGPWQQSTSTRIGMQSREGGIREGTGGGLSQRKCYNIYATKYHLLLMYLVVEGSSLQTSSECC